MNFLCCHKRENPLYKGIWAWNTEDKWGNPEHVDHVGFPYVLENCLPQIKPSFNVCNDRVMELQEVLLLLCSLSCWHFFVHQLLGLVFKKAVLFPMKHLLFEFSHLLVNICDVSSSFLTKHTQRCGKSTDKSQQLQFFLCFQKYSSVPKDRSP